MKALIVIMAALALAWMRDPVVYVCESDGELVADKDVRIIEGIPQRVDDVDVDGTIYGCPVHRMRRSDVCTMAVCE